ncbi:MAG TPA: phospholipase [Pseudoneobacillus sp.]|nr:phospholipase [Pseudoneobacillus sp.]
MSNNRRIVKGKGSTGCIFPNYRWCGPGCSGPGKPINDVDACCMRHDLCLRRGISPCQCDEELINCLKTKINSHTEKGRNAEIMYYALKIKTFLTCRW